MLNGTYMSLIVITAHVLHNLPERENEGRAYGWLKKRFVCVNGWVVVGLGAGAL